MRRQVGAHLAHISTGNGGKGGVGRGSQKGHFLKRLLPFRALRHPAVPTLDRLDKAEVTGSSPVSPIREKARKSGPFLVSGEGAGVPKGVPFPADFPHEGLRIDFAGGRPVPVAGQASSLETAAVTDAGSPLVAVQSGCDA